MKARVRMSLEVDEDTPPLDAVRGIRDCLEGIESGLRANVARARQAGHSWQEIADALGVTKQSAWERFGSSQDEERSRAIDSVVGSLKRPGLPTSDEMREMSRREEQAVEERKKREGSW
jgi:hypothetical protein